MINGDSYQRVERVPEEALIPEADVRETAQIVDVPSPWLWCPDHVPPVGAPVIILDQGMPLLDAEVNAPTAPWTEVECWWMPLPPPPAGWSADAPPSNDQEKADISPAAAPGANEDPAMDALPAGVFPADAELVESRPHPDFSPEDIAQYFGVPLEAVRDALESANPAGPTVDVLQTGGMLGYAPRSPSTAENAGEAHLDRRAENALRQAAPVALGALAMLDLITSEGGDDVFHGMPRDRQEAYLAEIYNVVQRAHDCMVAFEEQSA